MSIKDKLGLGKKNIDLTFVPLGIGEIMIVLVFEKEMDSLPVDLISIVNGTVKDGSITTEDKKVFTVGIIPSGKETVTVSMAKETGITKVEIKYPVLLHITPSNEDVIKVRITLVKPLVPVLSIDELQVTNASIKENSLIVDDSGLIYEVDIIPSGTEVIEISLLTTIEDDLKVEVVEIPEEKVEEAEESTCHKRLKRTERFRK